MAKKKDKSKDTPENNENIGTVPQTPVVIHAQYLKDMSFENPNSPEILQKVDTAPAVDIDISVDMRKLELEDAAEEHFYEVVLTVNASAKRDDKVMFIAEIKYGATVSIQGMDDKKHHPILFVEVPRMLFPFIRMLLANATQAGGFIPLQMGMVNFRAMYLQRFGEKTETDENSDS